MDHPATKRKGRGGKRPGAGRPAGSTNTLEYGEVKAVKSLGWRVPEAAPQPIAAVADEAWDKIVAVMRGEVSSAEGHAANVLRASFRLRDEACGPLAQKINHGDADGKPLAVAINITRTVKK